MKARQVSFRTTGEVVTALLRGDAAFALEPLPCRPRPGGLGRLRLLAVTTLEALAGGPERSDARGERPSRLRLQRLVRTSSFPRARRSRSSTRCTRPCSRCWRDEDVKKKLEGAGAIANLSTPAEFRELIESDIESFRAVATKAGLEANRRGRWPAISRPGAAAACPHLSRRARGRVRTSVWPPPASGRTLDRLSLASSAAS